MNKVEESLGVEEEEKHDEEEGGADVSTTEGGSPVSDLPRKSPPPPLDDELLLQPTKEEYEMTDLGVEEGEMLTENEGQPQVAGRKVENTEKESESTETNNRRF